jgi:hypothetical protein
MVEDTFIKLQEELKKDRIRHEEDRIRFEEKMNRDADDLDKLSMQNFSAWRDYLHKYYTLILAFIGGSGLITLNKEVQDYRVVHGMIFALLGIMIGFLGINLYFYLERKWIQAQNLIKIGGYTNSYEHPDVAEGQINKAIRLNLKAKLKEFQKELKLAKIEKNVKKIRDLRFTIKARKEEILIVRFIGEQFSLLQVIWLGFVTASLVLTFWGIWFIFQSLII